MKFKWIIALSALFIAGCAAYFSVSGIAMLFSGSLLGVAIMAASLELGKLVAASYLHRKWKELNTLFKYYMSFAVIVLIFITSMGIFGFLSNAYQKTALMVDQVEGQVELLQLKSEGFTSEIERFENRADVLQSQRSAQEARYDTLIAGEDWVNARRTFELIESADADIRELNTNITANRDSVNSIQTQILSIRADNMDLAREIGGFKFVAEAFDVEIETAVKWFIILLIFVFDPLAVSLVIAFNSYYVEDEDDYDDVLVINRKEKDEANASSISFIEADAWEDQREAMYNAWEKNNKSGGLGVVHNKAQKKPNEKKEM